MKKTLITIVMTILGVIVFILLGWTIIIPVLITKFILEFFFTRRVTQTIICDDNKFYPGLIEDPRYFQSKDHKLYGAFFTHEGHKPFKGVMIVSHGIGCSHLNYLQVIDYFTRKDYLVFAFDMTGCCKSEGDKGMEGLQRSIIDLRSAILFVANQPEAQGLDLFVFGHSWSGYASACVLNDDEVCSKVKAVATLAGFNNPWSIMKDQGIKKVGSIVKLARPFAHIYGKLKFGNIVNYKGIKGINHYKGPVFVAHSTDDKTVEYRYSIERLKDKCTNPLAEFHTEEGLGHTLYRPVESEKAIDAARKGKEPLALGNKNVFQWFMDDRYRFSKREDVFGLNEKYLDKVEDFFERSRGVIC